MKTLALLVFLLPITAWSADRNPPTRCYLYDASGNAITSTAGALNIAGGIGGGGGGDASAANQLTANTKLDTLHTDLTSSQTRACTKSGTWAIDSIGGTVAISAASLPLPTGAATSAKQPALGTAGSASADVLSVQGVASMTALKVDGSGVTQPVSGTFWPSTQPVSGTFWQTTQPVSIASMPSTPVTGTFWQATQPISAASLPLPAGAAQDATLTGGTAKVQIATSTKATYWTGNGATAFTPVATATDMVQIQGSASKTIRVLDFVICPSATAAGAQTVYLVKRSVANSGGTSTLPTLAPLDSTSATATAVVRQYSANATSLGTQVGASRSRRVMFQITAGTTAIEPCTNLLAYVSDNIIGQPFTLHGTAESLSLNNNAATLAAGYKIDSWYMVWTEE
jgi:hypothetical protein